MTPKSFASLVRPGTQRIAYRDSTGRRIEALWHDDDTVDVRFWSVHGGAAPYIHRGITAATVESAAVLHGWREIGDYDE